MIDDLPLRQLNVDSRARVGTAGTASSFKIELLEAVEMPKGAAAWVTEIQSPIAWRNVEPQVNDRVYYSLRPSMGRRATPWSNWVVPSTP